MSAKKEEPAKEAAAPAAEAPAAKKGMNPIIPLVLVVVLAPVLSLVVGKFVLLPAMTKQLAAAPAEGEHGDAAAADDHGGGEEKAAEGKGHGEKGGHGKKGESAAGGAGNTYEFENVVVNLAGTMGTRYLKTTFIVTGKDKGLRASIENNKPKMIDVTINVLSSLSLADLEEAGAKNIIREKLIAAYNQALEKRVAEQIYFTDFVVQ
ncbi:flagellar basal body-associated protein FliL [Nibricoccus sp. IMCC34717]|uniref:flagellar basal body-associated FliL family protein n=1 Tax=Nibricoccus sp. IMCC34717 TaxID=3034021 RepID=UPI00384DD6C3